MIDLQNTSDKILSCIGLTNALNYMAWKIEGVEPERILREMHLVSEGYLWELQKKGVLNIDEDVEKIEADFREMIAFWKKIYLRKKG